MSFLRLDHYLSFSGGMVYLYPFAHFHIGVLMFFLQIPGSS